MDCIFIEGLRARTVIGIYDWEKAQPQTLTLNLTLYTSIETAAAQDALGFTIDYEALSQSVVDWADAQRLELIETFAHRLAQHLLAHFNLQALDLELIKPVTLAGAPNKVGLKIHRTRSDFSSSHQD